MKEGEEEGGRGSDEKTKLVKKNFVLKGRRGGGGEEDQSENKFKFLPLFAFPACFASLCRKLQAGDVVTLSSSSMLHGVQHVVMGTSFSKKGGKE